MKIGFDSKNLRAKWAKVWKVIPFILVFGMGYGGANFINDREALKHELDDFQRDISISSRLLNEYRDRCDALGYFGFVDYIEHNNEKYALVLNKAASFPYFLNTASALDHELSVYEFDLYLKESKVQIEQCETASR